MNAREIIVAAALVACAASAQANVLSNPGFESSVTSSTGPIGNWTRVGEGGRWSTGNAFEGQGAFSVWGIWEPVGAGGPLTSIYQIFSTTSGQRYDLSFAYKASSPGLGADPVGYGSVTVSSGSIGSFTEVLDQSVQGDGTWRTFRSSFVATGTQSEIAFARDPNTSLGLRIDSVNVTPVPEPGTYAMLGSGMLALIGALRRRRGGAAIPQARG